MAIVRLSGNLVRANSRTGWATAAAGWLAFSAACVPASAQTLQEVQDAMEMMVGSAAICSDYLQRPEVLEDTRRLGRDQFAKAGLSEADAESFMDKVQATAMAEPSNEMQKQVACEIVNIPALK